MLDGDKVRVASWSANKMAAELQAKEAAVSNFRDYLRIKTVQPNPDIGGQSYVKLLLCAPLTKRPPCMIFHLYHTRRGRHCVSEAASYRHWSGLQRCGGRCALSAGLQASRALHECIYGRH